MIWGLKYLLNLWFYETFSNHSPAYKNLEEKRFSGYGEDSKWATLKNDGSWFMNFTFTAEDLDLTSVP